jgi:hypothetical protein
MVWWCPVGSSDPRREAKSFHERKRTIGLVTKHIIAGWVREVAMVTGER